MINGWIAEYFQCMGRDGGEMPSTFCCSSRQMERVRLILGSDLVYVDQELCSETLPISVHDL